MKRIISLFVVMLFSFTLFVPFRVNAANDAFDTAQSISIENAVSGSLSTSQDANYYRFTLSENGAVSLGLRHEFVDSSSSYWSITLYDNQRQKIYNTRYRGNTTAEEVSAKIGLPAGTFFVKVEPYSYSPVTYQLTVHFSADKTWETEKNDIFSSADKLVLGQTVCGSVMASNDKDYYAFSTSRAGTVRFDFQHEYVDSSSSYWTVTLYNGNCEKMMSRRFTGNTIKNISSCGIGLPAGNYYLVVEAYSHSDVTYQICVNLTPDNTWETENNDTFSVADAVITGQTMHGSIMESNDKDYYQFKLNSRGTIQFNFQHEYVDSSSSYWSVSFYDQNYDKLTVGSKSYAGNTLQKETTELTLDAGTYYVRVEGYSHSDVTYEFSISGASLSDPDDTDSGDPCASGHAWGSWTATKAATCTGSGAQTRTCTICGEIQTKTISATGHNWDTWKTNDVTCTADGLRTRTCKVCGEVQSEIIKATGHNYKKTTSNGVTYYTCTACGDTYTEGVATLPFTDRDAVTHIEAVAQCVDLEIIFGYPDGSFRPKNSVTRAEMCKMLCVAMTNNPDQVGSTKNNPSFTDIKGHWAEGYIEFCYSEGIVAGVGHGKFNPNDKITGVQAAKMVLVSILGKDSSPYIGSAWAAKVNADANAYSLYDELTGIDLTKAIDRESVAQMIWNAIIQEYDQIVINDSIFDQ